MDFWRRIADPSSGRCLFCVFCMSPPRIPSPATHLLTTRTPCAPPLRHGCEQPASCLLLLGHGHERPSSPSLRRETPILTRTIRERVRNVPSLRGDSAAGSTTTCHGTVGSTRRPSRSRQVAPAVHACRQLVLDLTRYASIRNSSIDTQYWPRGRAPESSRCSCSRLLPCSNMRA